MPVDLLYNKTIWLLCGVILIAAISISCGGQLLFDRLVDIELRREHNDVTGFTIAVVGVVYAVLLAFIAVATWETYSNAGGIVGNEANYLGNIYRDTAGLPDDIAARLRSDLKQYARTVINVEWPAQEAGNIVTPGWAPLDDFHIEIATFQPKTSGEAVIQAEILHSLNELYGARESRLTAATGHLDEVLWWMIVMGGALSIGYTYLFGMKNFQYASFDDGGGYSVDDPRRHFDCRTRLSLPGHGECVGGALSACSSGYEHSDLPAQLTGASLRYHVESIPSRSRERIIAVRRRARSGDRILTMRMALRSTNRRLA